MSARWDSELPHCTRRLPKNTAMAPISNTWPASTARQNWNMETQQLVRMPGRKNEQGLIEC
jgi:hypothetical protein